jgi:hypothetical protein
MAEARERMLKQTSSNLFGGEAAAPARPRSAIPAKTPFEPQYKQFESRQAKMQNLYGDW